MNYQIFENAVNALTTWRMHNSQPNYEFPDIRIPDFQKLCAAHSLTAQDFGKAIVCLCCWREMRSELYTGMIAVANVINNRAKKGWYGGDPYTNTIEKNQFSSMTVPSDPQLDKYPDGNDVEFGKLLDKIDALYDGQLIDRTDGALYYAVLADSTSSWFLKNIADNPTEHPRTAQIGQTIFFE